MQKRQLSVCQTIFSWLVLPLFCVSLGACNEASFSRGEDGAGSADQPGPGDEAIVEQNSADSTGSENDFDSGGTNQVGDLEGDVIANSNDILGDAANQNAEIDGGLGGGSCGAQLFKTEDIQGLVDVVFVLDSSSSMNQEILALKNNFADFLRQFIVEQQQIDFQLFIISGAGDGGEFTLPADVLTDPRVVHIDPLTDHPQGYAGVDSHNGLGMAWDFMSGVFPVPAKPLSLRPEAVTEWVFLTDDDANDSELNGLLATTFEQNVLGLATAGEMHINGFLGLGAESPCQDATSQGYLDLAVKPQFVGLTQNICNPDWGILLNELATAIISKLKASFKLECPAEPGTIIVKVNGTALDVQDFEYNAQSQTVYISPNINLNPADNIEINYGY
jgi:hypothetical protein